RRRRGARATEGMDSRVRATRRRSRAADSDRAGGRRVGTAPAPRPPPPLKTGCTDRLLSRVLARPSLYPYVLSRGSLRAFAYSARSPRFWLALAAVEVGVEGGVV